MESIIHHDSLRADAYDILNGLTGSGVVDDTAITIYQVESILKDMYAALLAKDDDARMKWLRPEPARIVTRTVYLTDATCEACDEFERTALLPDYLQWNKKPYIESIATCGVAFTDAKQKSFLKSHSLRTGRPTFVIEGGGAAQLLLRVRHNAQTIAVDELEITGAYKDPFYGLGQDDPFFWQQPWSVKPDLRMLAKERARLTLMGSSVATWQRADKKNDALETPVNR